MTDLIDSPEGGDARGPQQRDGARLIPDSQVLEATRGIKNQPNSIARLKMVLPKSPEQ